MSWADELEGVAYLSKVVRFSCRSNLRTLRGARLFSRADEPTPSTRAPETLGHSSSTALRTSCANPPLQRLDW